MTDVAAFNDPTVVAAEVAALGRPLLAAFDVDGVLAPIVAHAADAALLPGLLDALGSLSARTRSALSRGATSRTSRDLGFRMFCSSSAAMGLNGGAVRWPR